MAKQRRILLCGPINAAPAQCLCGYKNGTCAAPAWAQNTIIRANQRAACTCCSTCTGTMPVPVRHHAPSIKAGTCTYTECVCYAPLFIYCCVALVVISGGGHARPRPNCACVSCPSFVLLVAPRGSWFVTKALSLSTFVAMYSSCHDFFTGFLGSLR